MGKRIDIAERLRALGVDPVEGMARIALQAERDNNLTLAAKTYAELLQYCAPKLKSMEHSIAPETQNFIERQQRLERIKTLLEQLAPTLAGNGVIEGEFEVLKHTPEPE